MKQKLLCGLLALAAVPAALSQTPDVYENWGFVLCPPEIPPTIDASIFVNHGQFIINFTNQSAYLPVSTPPYETSSTLNYTNDFGAAMSCNTGFRMEDYSLQSGQRQRAASIYNPGTINCGTAGTSNFFLIPGTIFNRGGSGAGITCQANATNILIPGSINMGFQGLLSLKGDNIDLSKGTLAMENTGFTLAQAVSNNVTYESIVYNNGFFDGYWGLGTNTIDPEFLYGLPPPITEFHLVTNRNYQILFQQLGGPSFVPYLLDVSDASGSNRTVRAVFLSNTNPAIIPKVYFRSFIGDPYFLGPDIVDLSSAITNAHGVTTNYLYVEDTFLVYTNFELFLNGNAGVGVNRPTYIPENYTFFSGSRFSFGTPATATSIPPGTFGFGVVTNNSTAYQALFQPGSVVLGDVAGQNLTNMPGRIELTADKYLALPQAQISSGNYVLLKATNQFGGSIGAQINSPYADIYLRSTNGLLSITNVLEPVVPRPVGTCDLFSSRWTNITTLVTTVSTNTITNRFHVLFVDAQFSPVSTPTVQTLSLTATNAFTHDDSILISDVFNVSSNVLINTRRLTLTTNAPGALAPVGILNYLSSSILWPASTPRLQYLTNYGAIQAPNLIVFGGSQASPFSSPVSSTNPYAAFVNVGTVTNFGSSIFSTYFQNSGIFFASGGAIQLRQAQTAILTNGAFLAPGGPGAITIQGGSLLVSNHVLQAGSALTLSLTNYLDDGSLSAGADAVTNRNTWYAGYGINLPVRPALASLLATTINSVSSADTIVPDLWAGQDRGPVVAGYSNNAALGRLILDGGFNSAFAFRGPATSNALYVDYLECRDYMTNFDNSGNLANLQFAPGMKIYYAQLIINGVSWAEKLNGKNGGGLNWVPSYAGTFSSTNMVYPDGTTNRLNLALVTSCDLDSNGNGIPNCLDPAPVLISSQLSLAAVLSGGTNIVLSWNGVPFKSNYLEFKLSQKGTAWTPLTNIFVPGPASQLLQVTDRVTNTIPQRFYRVRVP